MFNEINLDDIYFDRANIVVDDIAKDFRKVIFFDKKFYT